MADTKENILVTALRLFARDGYEAVSVSMIAGELGMAKSALYKHYKSKQDLLDSILLRMEEQDARHAREHGVPEGTLEEMQQSYSRTQIEEIRAFSKAQFHYWTEDLFCSDFRRMLTLEQYRSEKMSQYYQQYLVAGPLGYLTDLFAGMGYEGSKAKDLAVQFYAPMFFFYSMYDGAGDRETVVTMLEEHIDHFLEKGGTDHE